MIHAYIPRIMPQNRPPWDLCEPVPISATSLPVAFASCFPPLATHERPASNLEIYNAGLKRGRPLFLNEHRYQVLKNLYLRHRVAQEVSTIRASLDRVIRENYY